MIVALIAFQVGVIIERNVQLGIDVSTNSIHVTVYVQKEGDPEPVFWDHHAGNLTHGGREFIEGKLGASGHANNTDYATYISLSTDSGGIGDLFDWVVIPGEIAADGLERANATYADSDVGEWTLTYQFTASDTHTNVQMTGLNWESATDGLMAADTFTAVTLNSGEKITVEWTITIS